MKTHQNTSHAVMAQRREPKDSLDLFPTPPWATRALCEWLLLERLHLKDRNCWEPAAGQGHMVKPLREYFATVTASDVYPHSPDVPLIHDFLMPGRPLHDTPWIITNPPFRLGLQFARRALELATEGVALLVRTSFLESVERYEQLFRFQPPTHVLQFSERVPMVKGRLEKDASTATSYCWLVWRHQQVTPERCTAFIWIPPMRKKLEAPGDYQ